MYRTCCSFQGKGETTTEGDSDSMGDSESGRRNSGEMISMKDFLQANKVSAERRRQHDGDHWLLPLSGLAGCDAEGTVRDGTDDAGWVLRLRQEPARALSGQGTAVREFHPRHSRAPGHRKPEARRVRSQQQISGRLRRRSRNILFFYSVLQVLT